MAALDFLFGAKPLKKAAQTGDTAPPYNQQDAGIDMAAEAAKSKAAMDAAKPPVPSPAPILKKKKPATANMASNLMSFDDSDASS